MADVPEIDHDFFDDGPSNGDKNSFAFSKNTFHKNSTKESESDKSSSISSNSEYKSFDQSHGNSYQSSRSDQNSTLKSSSRSSSYSSDNDTSLHSRSLDSCDEKSYGKNDSDSTKHDVNKKTVVKRKPKMIKIFSSSSRKGDSSDSVTDVSPLTSPESSPSFGHFVIPNRSKNKTENMEPVRHITKLNVTFTGSSGAIKTTQQHENKDALCSLHGNKQNKSSNSYSGTTYAWSSSSEDEFEANKHSTSCDNTSIRKKNKQQLHVRQDYARTTHRQRLLDSAARGSMDVSSLLETVLEFEKKNHERKVHKDEESQMNYSIGERFLKGKQRQNMSFSNDQVRDIDRENRRLLKEITSRSRPSSASSVRSSASLRSNVSRSSSKSTSSRPGSSRRPDSSKPCKLYHTALNRIQQQRQIERENMLMLKRLQSAKPSNGLQRQRLLADHKRQSDYMGTTLNRSGMSLKKAQELTRNAEVVQKVIGLHKNTSRPVRPAWQDSW